MEKVEQRFINGPDYRADWRTEKRDGKPTMITGYPAKFNKQSRMLWGFREVILPGAFTRTLAAGADVRGLKNHNPDLIFGRTRSGTMRLKEDSVGLRMEADAADTQFARDLMTEIDRGDIDQGSFRFITQTDNWRMQDGVTIRELVDVDLLDASVVTFPAYEDTTAGVRSALAFAGLDFARVQGIMVRALHHLDVGIEDRDFLGSAIDTLNKTLRDVGDPTGSLEIARRRLMLAERPVA
jgi:HK97 family phage prohead protease